VSGMRPLRFADVVIVVALAPFAIAFGAPVLGVAVGCVGWVLARAFGVWADRRTAGETDPRRALSIGFASSLGRVWLLALSILAVGKAADRSDGLAAALVVLVAFTIHFAMTLLLRPARGASRARRAPAP